MSSKSTKASPEQMRYANILSMGAWGGIVLLFVTYIIYLSGIMGAHVPMQDVIANWDKGVDEYMHITNSPHGWAWLSLIHEGDFLNFIGIAVLALMTIVCYFTLIPGYLKKRQQDLRRYRHCRNHRSNGCRFRHSRIRRSLTHPRQTAVHYSLIKQFEPVALQAAGSFVMNASMKNLHPYSLTIIVFLGLLLSRGHSPGSP